MPGPPQHVDQRHEQRVGHPAETAAPGSRDDVRQRLARLPDGHPSSPRDDDGSLKRPLPRLSDVELPLPDEMDDDGADREQDKRELGRHAGNAAPEARTAGPPDRSAPGEAAAADHDADRTPADGAWEWKGLRLTPDQARIAERAQDRCRAAEGRDADGNYGEHGLTPAMRRVETQLEHGHLVADTEKYALKSPDRFNEKLAKRVARLPHADPEELGSEIHDGVRYTFIFEVEHYTSGVTAAQDRISDAGYVHIETRPSWDTDEYKGVNSRWLDPDTQVTFEIQFHTPQSWEAKQQTHDSYEKIGDNETPLPEVERLRAFQREISATVATPPGALEIQAYKNRVAN